jgi:hypothetical protein
MMLAIGLSYIAFTMLRYIPASIEMINGFVFACIDMLYYIYRFEYVEAPLHPWDEANLVMVYDLSDVLLDSDCYYFIKDFCIDIH